MASPPTRIEDELLLDMLDLHRAGLTIEQICRTLGTAPRATRRRIRETIRADTDADPAAREYWDDMKGPPCPRP